MRRPLRCYLLRAGRSPTDSLSESGLGLAEAFALSGDAVTPMDSLGSLSGTPAPHEVAVATFSSTTGPQWWQKMLGEELGLDNFAVGANEHRGALVFSSVEDPKVSESVRWIVWAFGTGGRYLERAALEPRFGVITALNRIVGEGGHQFLLRKIQYRQEGAFRQRVGHVANTDIPLGGFRMDELRDLLGAVGGRPSDDETQVFGSRGYVFRTTIEALLDSARAESKKVVSLYREERYRVHFAFVDHYFPVDDPDLTASLEKVLVEDILGGGDNVDFVYPDDLLDFNDERDIELIALPGEQRTNASLKNATIHTVRRLIEQNPDDGLDQTLRFLDSDGEQVGTASVRDCLSAELRVGNERFYLADGSFYDVDQQFLADLDEYLDAVPGWDDGLPPYVGGHERVWTEAASADRFAVLDGMLITPPNRTPFEPADLVHRTGALIYAKRKGRSSALSYLFVQASVSCQMLGEPDVVRELRTLIDENAPDQIRASITEALAALDQTRPDLPVVLAILGDWRNKSVSSLPLIAKIELRATIRTVVQLGFRPHLALVPLAV